MRFARFFNSGGARAVAIALTLLVVNVAAASGATRVWIDTDPSLGAAYREVDDAFALVLAFRSPELRIAGISTTFGNAGVKRTTVVARDLVRRFGAAAGVGERSVYAGASGPKMLGRVTPAADALARAVRDEPLTYIALGPLTNLATFLELHPELAPRIERVVFVGGRTPGRVLAYGASGALKIHDANVFKDPAAVRAVLASSIPIDLAPPETAGQVLLTRAGAKQLAADGAAAKFLQHASRVWLWFWTGVAGNRGGPLFDSLGVTMVVRPRLVEASTRYAVVRPTGELIAASRTFSNARRVTFATAVSDDAGRFVVDRLCSDNAPARSH